MDVHGYPCLIHGYSWMSKDTMDIPENHKTSLKADREVWGGGGGSLGIISISLQSHFGLL